MTEITYSVHGIETGASHDVLTETETAAMAKVRALMADPTVGPLLSEYFRARLASFEARRALVQGATNALEALRAVDDFECGMVRYLSRSGEVGQ